MDICHNLLFGTIDHVMIPWIIFNRQYDLLKIGAPLKTITEKQERLSITIYELQDSRLNIKNV